MNKVYKRVFSLNVRASDFSAYANSINTLAPQAQLLQQLLNFKNCNGFCQLLSDKNIYYGDMSTF